MLNGVQQFPLFLRVPPETWLLACRDTVDQRCVKGIGHVMSGAWPVSRFAANKHERAKEVHTWLTAAVRDSQDGTNRRHHHP